MVLLVDDDSNVRQALRTLVESKGHRLVAVANGAEALDYLRTARDANAPDLILLDLQMPVMDGWGFLALRGRDPVLGAIPVVVISGDDAAETRLLAANAGYFRKPVDPDTLIAAIERAGTDSPSSSDGRKPVNASVRPPQVVSDRQPTGER